MQTNIDLLAVSLSVIEERLSTQCKTEEVAAACACSRSTLDKLYRYVYNISVHDYIIRRRMMKAAKLLSSQPEMSILDIALECGYNSHEAFTRAFRSVWAAAPSEFKGKAFPEMYPKLSAHTVEGDAYIMTRKHFDITELYNYFRQRENCWFICCDIRGLVPINEISNKAGDLAILTALTRMNEAAGEEDLVIRIGGDEFCILTAVPDEAYADQIMQNIAARNGEAFCYEGQEISLSLSVSKTQVDLHTPKYDALFSALHQSIRESK